MEQPRKTLCECDVTGKEKQWCERHGCYKSPHEVRKCQILHNEFNVWENCQGRGQPENCSRKSEPIMEPVIKNGGFAVNHSYNQQRHIRDSQGMPYEERSGGCKSCRKKKSPVTQNHKTTEDKQRQEKREEIRPPSVAAQGWNFAKAVTKYVSTGGKKVDEHQFAERMAICDNCEYRSGPRCLKCGCFLEMKASWASADCPIGKWPKVDA
tara:strand:+ start:6869 stop:7498 length:630 start_codon:yes stop_codon:yes gene_type:complete